MNSEHTMISYQQQQTFQIAKNVSVKVNIEKNPYNLPLEQFFDMALRNNKKRAFLFVSKWLGKHIPIPPQRSLFAGALLAYEYIKQFTKDQPSKSMNDRVQACIAAPEAFKSEEWIFHTELPITFIGFAETATALGHSMFRCFPNAQFFHTTREKIDGLKTSITFEEEHSHATSHRCYVDTSFLDNNHEVVLVDDELTTGKTVRNIIRSMQAEFPRKKYTVVSILDWRSEEDQNRFCELERECGCKIHVVSLVKGTMSLEQEGELLLEPGDFNPSKQANKVEVFWHQLAEDDLPPFQIVDHYSMSLNGDRYEIPFLRETGRFGLYGADTPNVEEWIEKIAEKLKRKRSGQKLLCLGSGEFMFLPMLLASHMGEGVSYHSTTRSPIHVWDKEGYGAQSGFTFPAPIDGDVQHFVYNIAEGMYDEIWVFYERKPKKSHIAQMCKQLSMTGIRRIGIHYFL
ncbi:phosphoribosyltransferase family protein [Bacillus carboniphilus]|uniref:Phosphoribosyltransferase family protein n=1 Tax=Bacillus carboniphilus TaxID=86663 RepID=A0ABP3GMV8_9BACI